MLPPCVPGVMMVEMGLQAVQVMLTDIDDVDLSRRPSGAPAHGYLLSISDFRFHKPTRPGDVLRSTVTLMQALGGVRKAQVKIVDGEGADVAAGVVVVGDAK